MIRREAARWAVTTLPLAALAGVVYLAFEWLFIVTTPSPTAALPFATRIGVLLASPLPLLLPLMGIQAGFSAACVVAYPRLRWLGVVPAAVVGGLLLLVLLDNFTYTLFGLGILNVPSAVRPAYAAWLLVGCVLTGRKILGWLGVLFARRGVAAVAFAAALVLALLPMAASTASQAAAPGALPDLRTTAGGGQPLPNILLIGIDGVDAPLLSAYGYERPTTPFLEELRDESLFFENAFANVGRTHGSLVGLLTGRLPFSTRVTFPPTILQGDDARRNLPALLKPLGYSSLQLGMRHYADAEDANLLGFDAANYRWQTVNGLPAGEPAADETGIFRAKVAERLDERVGQLFGFRHAIDGFAVVEGTSESPYWSDERRVDTLDRYVRAAPEPWFVHIHMLDTHCCAYRPKAPVPGWSNYESVIRETDGNVRRIYDALERQRLLDRTVLVLYSDHTAEWTTTGRVPMMIRFPEGRRQGRVTANVQLADVAPTILAALDLPVPGWMDGLPLGVPVPPGRRPIFGISDIGSRHGVRPWLNALSNSEPPNYGAATVTMVVGAQWFELSLEDGTLKGGTVVGRVPDGLGPMPDQRARSLIQSELDRAGFKVGGPGVK